MRKWVDALRSGGLGSHLSLRVKLVTHLKNKNVRKVRNYLMVVKLAFPNKKFVETIDSDILSECRQLLSPYYVPNPNWKEGDNEWTIFTKISEPPN